MSASCMQSPAHLGRQAGAALLVGLIFLVVLSLVAIIAMRSTLLEMRMVNNVANHERAFEASDSLRGIPVALFNDHTFNRGWPIGEVAGGTVATTNFGSFPNCLASASAIGTNGVTCSMLNKTSVRQVGDIPINLYQLTLGSDENMYDPLTWASSNNKVPDVQVAICSDGGSSTCAATSTASIWVRPDGTTLEQGTGAAQAAGYRGLGNGAASGGGSMFFEVMSIGVVGTERAVTIAQYKQSISN